MNGVEVWLIDDHKMFLSGITTIINTIDEVRVTKCFSDAHVLLNELKTETPEIIITDISMPNMNGIDLIKKVNKNYSNVKVIVISMHTEFKILRTILKLQVQSYLYKNTDEDELVMAIKEVIKGNEYFPPDVNNIINGDYATISRKNKFSTIIPNLSSREKQVLMLLIEEKTTSDIASELFLSPHTVENYRKQLLIKFDVKNSVGLVNKAYQYGIL